MPLTIGLGDEVDVDTSKRGGALVDGLLGDTGGDIALGASGGSGGDCSASQGGTRSEKFASGNTDDGGERRGRAILDQRGEADGTGSDADGGTHNVYGVEGVI